MGRSAEKTSWQSYEGQFLIAMPSLRDGPFARSVVYICAHREDGAMGIIINQRAVDLDFSRLLVQLRIVGEAEAIRLPASAGQVRVLRGGPVDTARGFVLHSSDYRVADSTVEVGGDVCLTATLDILKAIAQGAGPSRAVLALGYAGWASGQLESEILANGWLVSPADSRLIFDGDFDAKYDRALARLGVNVAGLSSEVGHA
ncbi:MAG: YqgE/AlgH family protein [Bradyrhizobium sp.]|nr:MAG: YqgE/AlgH family protein [Bradyrhizobium sp.]